MKYNFAKLNGQKMLVIDHGNYDDYECIRYIGIDICCLVQVDICCLVQVKVKDCLSLHHVTK